jgi:hypothetical protein
MSAGTTQENAAKRAWKGWLRAGEKAAHIMGMVIFTVLWFVAVGPVALFVRLQGKHLLPHFTGKEETYYLPKAQIPATLELMQRQW